MLDDDKKAARAMHWEFGMPISQIALLMDIDEDAVRHAIVEVWAKDKQAHTDIEEDIRWDKM